MCTVLLESRSKEVERRLHSVCTVLYTIVPACLGFPSARNPRVFFSPAHIVCSMCITLSSDARKPQNQIAYYHHPSIKAIPFRNSITHNSFETTNTNSSVLSATHQIMTIITREGSWTLFGGRRLVEWSSDVGE